MDETMKALSDLVAATDAYYEANPDHVATGDAANDPTLIAFNDALDNARELVKKQSVQE
jgi:hypothetical protein